MTVLACVDCQQETETDLTEFDDMPIDQWWEAKGRRCVTCRRRAARPTRNKAAGEKQLAVRDVRRVLLAAGEQGATYDELCRALAQPYTAAAALIDQMVRDGHVHAATFTRPGNAGLDQEVWLIKTKEKV